MKGISIGKSVWGIAAAGLMLAAAAFTLVQGRGDGADDRGMTLPAGTAILVRVLENIDVSRQQDGQKFMVVTASETTLDGTVAVPSGTFGHACIVKEPQSAGLSGHALYGVKLTDLQVLGRSVPVDSSTARLTVDPSTGSTYPGPSQGVTLRTDTVINFTLKSPAKLQGS